MALTPESSSAPASVLHVLAPGQAGGLESVVQALATGLHQRGHRVGVLSVLGHEDPTPAFHRRLEREGVRVITVPLPPRAYRMERQAYREHFASFAPDVVHTHGYRSDVLAGPVARRAGIPRVATVHGFTGGDWKNRVYEFLQVRAWRHYQRVIAVSEPLAALLRRSGVSAGRLTMIPNAFLPEPTLSRDAARSRLGLPAGATVLGWVGRLSREKGLDLLVEALPGLDASVLLAVCGVGGERESLQAQAERLGVRDRIRWVGLVPQAAAVYPAFDVFVMSSRTEGTPIALFEAMHAGVPIVATRVGGVPDVVTDAEARLVPPESPGALAGAIREVLAAPEPAANRARAARIRLAERYAMDPWLDHHEALYRDVTAPASAPGRP